MAEWEVSLLLIQPIYFHMWDFTYFIVTPSVGLQFWNGCKLQTFRISIMILTEMQWKTMFLETSHSFAHMFPKATPKKWQLPRRINNIGGHLIPQVGGPSKENLWFFRKRSTQDWIGFQDAPPLFNNILHFILLSRVIGDEWENHFILFLLFTVLLTSKVLLSIPPTWTMVFCKTLSS